jgi:ribulose-phosphate 3-epimerase
MPKLSASLLAADYSRINEEVARAHGFADSFHVDVMDDLFVPNYTLDLFPPAFVEKTESKLPFEIHLMVDGPASYFEDYAMAGANSITFHVEAVDDCEKALNELKALKVAAGIAVKPATTIASVEPLLSLADSVTLMTVEPGFGGQSFVYSSLSKIRELREKFKGEIVVDGGVNETTASECVKAGADVLVAGTAFFKAKNLEETARKLKQVG